MGRKNNKVRSRNIKGRMDRRQRGIPRPKMSHQPRVELEDLVLPDRQCYFPRRRKPKAGFADKAKAEKALKQAKQQRARSGSTHVEKRVYRCPEGGCGGWHLTSREEFDSNAWKGKGA